MFVCSYFIYLFIILLFVEANGQNPLQRVNTPKKMEFFFKTDKLMLLTNLLNAELDDWEL
jgi:hypothetical protein